RTVNDPVRGSECADTMTRISAGPVPDRVDRLKNSLVVVADQSQPAATGTLTVADPPALRTRNRCGDTSAKHGDVVATAILVWNVTPAPRDEMVLVPGSISALPKPPTTATYAP